MLTQTDSKNCTKVVNIDENTDTICRREQDIQNIESELLEINDTMRELNSIICTQGDLVDNIEKYIDDSNILIDKGTNKLEESSIIQPNLVKDSMTLSFKISKIIYKFTKLF